MNNLKGTMLLGEGDLDGAEKLATGCLEAATRKRFRKYIGKAERLLGQIFTKRAAYDSAEASLRSALKNLEKVGNPKQLWMTQTTLAELYGEMNRPDRAREHWQAAAAVVRSTADGLEEPNLRETFLGAASVRQIAEHADL
jgi:tetratricopeptide (TPR) repeat protein